MHYFKLKNRIILYLFMLLLTLLFGKLLFVSKECKNLKNQIPSIHQNVIFPDFFNLNDHIVEFDDSNQIRKVKQRNVVEPIVAPDINLEKIVSENKDTSYLHQKSDFYGPHRLAIIVPYRNRFEEMKEFVPYMHKYLNAKKINHNIYIMNQVDKHRFNRASLINTGFLIARNESCDYIAMHDVDLMPLNPNLNYNYPELGPFHVAAPNLHPKYHYSTFVGGILLLSVDQFEELNGLSNIFWGWGREDDEFYMRISDKGFKVYRHGDEILTGFNTFKHFHGPERKRDYVKLPGQKKAMFSRDRVTGLSTLEYNIVKRQEIYIDGYHCSVIDVELKCDLNATPWCDLPVST
ncbi:beta-1,4-galactosyltransferase 7 isoform X1 [Hydra vulgaris]|uniref:Beta-1,4-galactosyltransferase n=1 Tax=Hydra vulgaris TaxID=6087 RepID=T2M4C7_HYDVU|nr:beta-1,4-galactosyltransferase 7-like [Hydra vulgaris]